MGLPHNIMTIDRDFVLQYLNPAAMDALRSLEEFLPVKADDLVGTCIDVFPQEPRLLSVVFLGTRPTFHTPR